MPQITTALLLCGERTMRAATQNLGLEFEQRNDDLPPSGDGDYFGAEESSLRRRSPERQRQIALALKDFGFSFLGQSHFEDR
ncbi:hypothetical protein DM860_014137 [Cuscuta australis]|uniref:Uncharacterized protein n=1 Tax=Cuscuta australis TaxID=267555 RepID=A0A328DFE4_9ASTE|nr:hypothetical protein DM860_014137 [Cuscuta australis]